MTSRTQASTGIGGNGFSPDPFQYNAKSKSTPLLTERLPAECAKRWISFSSDSESESVQPTRRKLRKKRFKRITYPVTDNVTFSRRVELGDSQAVAPSLFLGRIKDSLVKNRIKDAVVDHACRRLQIFYFQAVAYFDAQCTISLDRTMLQHGSAEREDFSAAHSSLLPSLCDNFFDVLLCDLVASGFTDRNVQLLKSLGISKGTIRLVEQSEKKREDYEFLLKEIDCRHSLLNKHCQFYHNMNSTVELPLLVNQYDCVIEDRLREEAVAILNRVSMEGMHPFEGLQALVEKLMEFFDESRSQTERKIELLHRMEKLENALWDIEQRFTKKAFPAYLKTLSKLSSIYHEIGSTSSYSVPLRIRGRLPWQQTLFAICKEHPSNKLYESISKQITSHPAWEPASSQVLIDKLEESLVVLELQKEGSCTPSYCMLSGKVVEGRRVALTREELFLQKLEIIQRSSDLDSL